MDRPFDLLCGIAGRFVVLEVKSIGRQRRDQQHQTDELLAAQAGGLPVYRVQTPEDAVQAIGVKH